MTSRGPHPGATHPLTGSGPAADQPGPGRAGRHEPFGARSSPGIDPGISPARRDHVRVMICDDHEVYRIGLSVLLAQASDLTLVGETHDPGQALMLAYENEADIVLMSQDLPAERAWS